MLFLFDIGGTKTRYAFVNEAEEIGEANIIPTPQTYSQALDAFIQIKKAVSTNTSIVKCIGGIAGFLSKDKSSLIVAPHLKDWEQKPFRSDLSQIFGCDVLLENDAALAGLGEATFGAGQQYQTVGYLTFGTGVGGIKVVDKKIDKSSIGIEPGHHIIDIDSVSQNEKKDLEYFASGSSIQKRFNLPPQEITDNNIWQEVMKAISVGIINAQSFWGCECIVLGGGIMKHPNIDIKQISTYASTESPIPQSVPLIKIGNLGELACIHGALAYYKAY
jgi:predicted NBD/HSP70 family sugar kinase